MRRSLEFAGLLQSQTVIQSLFDININKIYIDKYFDFAKFARHLDLFSICFYVVKI